ncbi:MAG: hypothetical protein KAX11_10145, partial [Candidatus Aminicenantes bacterium]|nr:hypothetical protein [Candidatus Aminicenantes bacterium]
CRHLGIAEGTVHCKDDDPEKCGMEIVSHVLKLRGQCRVGLVGFNPAIARKLVGAFGCGNVRIMDLSNDNIKSVKCGIRIEDGATASESLIRWADMVLITGTTLVNGTFDGLWNCAQEHGKNCLTYGITGAGVSSLTGIGRICPFGRNS